MTDHHDPADRPDVDAVLLAELQAAVAGTDQVPPWLLAAARDTLTWRTIDAELAELAYDSLADDDALVGVRGELAQRMLTFQSADVTVELQVDGAGSQRRLIGQVVPPAPGDIEAEHPDGAVRALVDAVGRFTLADVPAGPVRLACRLEDARAVQTPWLIL